MSYDHYKDFKRKSIPGVYYSADNMTCIAGHKAIFSGKPAKGFVFYLYNEQAPGWALHRRWNFGLFCVHHVGPGKATDPQGWHVTFATLKVKVDAGDLTIRWASANTFRTKRN